MNIRNLVGFWDLTQFEINKKPAHSTGTPVGLRPWAPRAGSPRKKQGREALVSTIGGDDGNLARRRWEGLARRVREVTGGTVHPIWGLRGGGLTGVAPPRWRSRGGGARQRLAGREPAGVDLQVGSGREPAQCSPTWKWHRRSIGVASRREDLSGGWTMATDGFGDAPVTGLGQEAAGRSVRGRGVLHLERKAQPRGQ
jgi:hypothetical protein